MIKIDVLNNVNKSISPLVEIEPGTELSSTNAAILLLWLEQGIFFKALHQTLSKQLDSASMKNIMTKFLTLKNQLNKMSEANSDQIIINAAKTPVVPSDGFLSFNGNGGAN